jgi:hypothetical protein
VTGSDPFANIFTPEVVSSILPGETADRFFNALLGDSNEGAYDIGLLYKGKRFNELVFEIQLIQRPGKCLACHLTYGLPQVFLRHPVINLKGVVGEIERLLEGKAVCVGWKLGSTREISRELHAIPFVISLDGSKL